MLLRIEIASSTSLVSLSISAYKTAKYKLFGFNNNNTSFEKYAGGISHETFRQKNLSSYHAAQIGCHFTWQLSIPPIGGYPTKILQYILSTWHNKCEMNAYTCLVSYNTMRRILNNS